MKQNLTVNFTSDGCFFGTPRMHKLDTILQTAVLESIFLHHHDHNKQVNIPFPSHRNKVFCQTLLCLNGSACKRHNTNLKFNKQSTVPRSCNHVLFVKKSANIAAASAAHVIINITERFFPSSMFSKLVSSRLNLQQKPQLSNCTQNLAISHSPERWKSGPNARFVPFFWNTPILEVYLFNFTCPGTILGQINKKSRAAPGRFVSVSQTLGRAGLI